MFAKSGFSVILALSAAILIFAGCSSFQMINEQAMTVDEIVKMSQAGVNKDVIIQQIDATYSRFKLTTDEIVKLTEAGVDKDVIKEMIDTGTRPGPYGWEYNTWPFDSWVNNWDYYGYGYLYPYNYYYPYYSYYYYYSPYVMYRVPSFVGRFYRYSPVVPPYLQYRGRDMERHYRQDRTQENKEER